MRKLRRPRPGDKPRAEDITQLIDAIEPLLNMRGINGIRITPSPSSVIISTIGARRGGGTGIEGEWPFEVVSAGNSETTGAPMVKVALESWLMLSQRPSDKQTIVGLGEPFEIAVDQLVWLEVSFDAMTETISGAEIKHGAPWLDYDNPVEFDNPAAENKRQTKARIVLAYTQAVPDPNPYTERPILSTVVTSGEPVTMQLVQCVTTHLLLCRTCFESDTVQLFAPFSAPGPAPAP